MSARARTGSAVIAERVMDMHTEALDGLLTFLRAAERLKVVTRSAWTSEGQRESVAEHTCRMPRGCADGGT
jgi:hypothetical protein